MAINIGTLAARKSLLSPQLTIMLVFFLQAFAGGGLFPRIPDIQTSLGLSEGMLGIVLMGQPVGGLVSILFASWIIERVGPKMILSATIPILALATVLTSITPSATATFAAMVLYGISFAFANMAMNVEADRVEAMTGDRVMNRCHGMWSLGFLVSSTIGAGARGVPLTPTLHFMAVLPVVVLVAMIFIWPMVAAPPRPHVGAKEKKKIFALPTMATILLVGVILAGVMTEVSVRAWSVIFMRDTFDVSDWVDAMTLPAFLFMLTAGRLGADRLVEKAGAVRTARWLLAVAFVGLALVLTAYDPYLAIGGFALMGLGICVLFPLVMSAAARIGDRPASENVTSVSLATNIIMLGTPALIGLIAELFSIRGAFMLLIPVLILALILSHHLASGEESSPN